MPRSHNDNDLRLRRETGFEGVLPLIPQLIAVCLAVSLCSVLHRVVYDEKVGGVTGDAGHNASAYHAAPSVGQLELQHVPDGASLHTEQRLAELLHLVQILPSELLRRVIVVAGLDDPVLRVPAEVPAWEALRDGDTFAVLRRSFYQQDVICVAGVLLDKLLHCVREEVAHLRPAPLLPVNVVQIPAVALSRQLTLGHLLLEIRSVTDRGHTLLLCGIL